MAEVAPRPAAAPARAGHEACLNCGGSLVGPYCHACGQRDDPPDLPARRMVEEALGDALSWDGRAFTTLRTLVRRPGQLAEDWAAGRRVRHVAPLRLYLLVSLAYVGTLAALDLVRDLQVPEADRVDQVGDDLATARDAMQGKVPAESVAPVARYMVWMVSIGLNWVFVLMPLGGFGLFVLYGLRRRSYPAHFVLAIHIFTVVVLLLAARRLIQLGVRVVAGVPLSEVWHEGGRALLWGVCVLSFLYAAASIKRFYGVGWGKAMLSAPAVTVGPIAAWFLIFAAGMVVVVSLA